mgnify:CR=1 FL=1
MKASDEFSAFHSRPAIPTREQDSGARRWMVFFLCASLFVCSQFHRVSNAVIALDLSRDLGISAESLGALTAAFFYSFAAMQIPLAMFLDRVGGRASMGFLSILGSAGVVGFSLAGSMEEAFLARILVGVGMAGNLMGSLKLISNWFPPGQFATLSGVLMALGTLGNMLAATPLALLNEATGWRNSIRITGLVTAALAVAFLLLVREAPPHIRMRRRGEDISLFAEVRNLLRLKEYWLISQGTFFRYGTFVAIQGLWAGPYLLEVLKVPPVVAGNLLLILNLGVIVGSPLGGLLSDRLVGSRKKVVLMGLGGMGFCLLALAMGWCGAGTFCVGAVFLALGVASSFGQVMYAHIKEMLPSSMTGMALTGINLFTMLGAAAFLQGMGWVLDRWATGPEPSAQGYHTAFVVAFGGVMLGLILYSFTRDAPRH